MKFTIGYIDHDKSVFDECLGNSLTGLKGEFDIIKTPSNNKPSQNYNYILKNSKNKYVILTHQDITFSNDLLERIEDTITKHQDFGVLGLVGVDTNKTYRWSELDKSHIVQTLDCCFIVIDKDTNVLFDEKNFKGLHLYVEDYCMEIKKTTNKVSRTILIHSKTKHPSFLKHHSKTFRKLGAGWGNYNFYKKVLVKKWGNVKTT
jgi:glycosyltransferase involved in cell wall biosynthesis